MPRFQTDSVGDQIGNRHGERLSAKRRGSFGVAFCEHDGGCALFR
jgi:hypothetical protein